jgi:hypothetical protein
VGDQAVQRVMTGMYRSGTAGAAQIPGNTDCHAICTSYG